MTPHRLSFCLLLLSSVLAVAQNLRELVVTTSGDGTLRIEQYFYGDHIEAWVISIRTGEWARLPEIDHAGHYTGASNIASEYEISPDDLWIFRTLKIVHDLNGAYLYRRDSAESARFHPATKEPLDLLARKFLEKATQVRTADAGVVSFISWHTDLEFYLSGSNPSVIDYNPTWKTFSIPPDH